MLSFTVKPGMTEGSLCPELERFTLKVSHHQSLEQSLAPEQIPTLHHSDLNITPLKNAHL